MKVKKQAKEGKSLWREYLNAIFWAILIAVLIRTWGVQAFKIPSGSMEPTLLVGDHLLVSKSSYGIHIPHEIDVGRGGKQSAETSWAGRILVPFSSPQRGDVIVFRNPEDRAEDYIKRIIALPGETVEIKDKSVIINGRPIDDPWGHFIADHALTPRQREKRYFGPVSVPPGHYFVMGDNRDSSHDSRMWFGGRGGFVPEQDILGQALIIYWSWLGDSYNVRWPRLGKIIY
ncbi:MAG: signal peptidase I [Desulfarculales bacterium]|nr:signal peptidase I [Desulfarculales bacterium]